MSSNLIRKLTFSLFGLLLVAAMAVPGMAQYDHAVDEAADGAPTYGASGNHTTINAALDAATSGQTIAIEAGTYDENVAADGAFSGTDVPVEIIIVEDDENGDSELVVDGNFTIEDQGGSAWTLTISENAADDSGEPDQIDDPTLRVTGTFNGDADGGLVQTLALGSGTNLTLDMPNNDFANNGALDLGGNTLTFSEAQALSGSVTGGGGTINGVNDVNSALTLADGGGDLTLNDAFDLSSTINLNGQTLTAGDATLDGAATIDGGPTTEGGTYSGDVSAVGQDLTLISDGTSALTFDGALTVETSTLDLNTASTDLADGAELIVRNDVDITTSAFTNTSGTYDLTLAGDRDLDANATTGANDVADAWIADNIGDLTIDLEDGLTVTGGAATDIAGDLTVNAGSELDLTNGDLTFTSSNQDHLVEGTVSNGTLQFGDNTATLDRIVLTGASESNGDAVIDGLTVQGDGTNTTEVTANDIQQITGAVAVNNGSTLDLELVGGDDDADGTIAGGVTVQQDATLDTGGDDLVLSGSVTVDLHQDATLNAGTLDFGTDDAHTVTLNADGLTIDSEIVAEGLTLGEAAQLAGPVTVDETLTMGGFELTYSGEDLSVPAGSAGNGTLILTGTTVTAAGDATFQDVTIDSDADSTVTLASGAEDPGRSTFTITGTLEQVAGNIDVQQNRLQLNGTWIRDAGEVMASTGRVIFNGTSLDITGDLSLNTLDVSSATDASGINVTVTDSLLLTGGAFTVDEDALTLSEGSFLRRAASGATVSNAPAFEADSTSTVEYTAAVTDGNELPDAVSELNVNGGTLTLSADKEVTVHDTLDLANQIDLNNDGVSVTGANGATAKLMTNAAVQNGSLTVAEDDTLNLWYDGAAATTDNEWDVGDGTIGTVTVASDVTLHDGDFDSFGSVGLTVKEDATLDLSDATDDAFDYPVTGNVMLESGADITNTSSADDPALSFEGSANQWIELDDDIALGVDVKLDQHRESSGKTAAGHIPLWTKLKGGELDLDGQTLHLVSGVAASESDSDIWVIGNGSDAFERTETDTTDSHIAGYVQLNAPSGNTGVYNFPTGSADGHYRPFTARFTTDNEPASSADITVNHVDSQPGGTSGLPIGDVESWSPFHWNVESSVDLGGGQTWGVELEAEAYGETGDYENPEDLRVIRRFAGSQNNQWSQHGSDEAHTSLEQEDGTAIVESSAGDGHLSSNGSLFAIGIPTSGPLAPSFVTVPESPIEIAEVPDTVSVQFTAEAADEDWSIESYAIDSGPAFASIDSSSGEVTLTPQEGDDGTYDLVVSATDSEGNTAMSETVSIEVGTATPIAEEDEVNELPQKFALQGNYPNPFNPTTNIAFDLPSQAQVSVTVYDMLGRQVMTVPTQAMQAGAGKTIQIDASRLASGAYVYRVVARMGDATKVSSGRMTLLK